MALDLIFTKSSLLLSKTSMDWRQWQNEFEDYMASLSFETSEELLDYLRMDYKLSDATIERLSSKISQDEREIMELNWLEITT